MQLPSDTKINRQSVPHWKYFVYFFPNIGASGLPQRPFLQLFVRLCLTPLSWWRQEVSIKRLLAGHACWHINFPDTVVNCTKPLSWLRYVRSSTGQKMLSGASPLCGVAPQGPRLSGAELVWVVTATAGSAGWICQPGVHVHAVTGYRRDRAQGYWESLSQAAFKNMLFFEGR